jgi:hypothetical protein
MVETTGHQRPDHGTIDESARRRDYPMSTASQADIAHTPNTIRCRALGRRLGAVRPFNATKDLTYNSLECRLSSTFDSELAIAARKACKAVSQGLYS